MKKSASKTPHILHLHSTFAPGGKELRSVRLMNAFGPKMRHSIVSAEPDRMQAAGHIARSIPVEYPADFPSLKGMPTPGRLHRLAKAMEGYDLICTYNWGAMDAVMAHTAFSQMYPLSPLIHHEDGFNEDEQRKRKFSRTWYRRIALGRASGLVVPSEVLEGIALVEWQQPIGRVKHIPNGVDVSAYRKMCSLSAIPRLVKRPGEKWVGTLAGLRTVKNLPALVRACAELSSQWHLVIVGEGPERSAIAAEAERLNISNRVHLPGFVADPSKIVGLFDVFALSSHSEQFPISVVEAMAAGLAIAAPSVGDIADMVSPENAEFITPPGDETELALAIATLAADEKLRIAIGRANREKAAANFDEKTMIATYRRLYASALKRDSLP